MADRPSPNTALDAAVKSVVEAKFDPLAVANEVRELRNATQASYALIFNLVKRAGGGPLRIDRGDMLIPANERLLMKQDAEGNVNLAIEKDG